MGNIKEYFSSVGSGVKSLLTGMGVTGKELVTPKITEQYPENRATLNIADRFRAELTLKYDAEGRHRCIACGICQMNCPNGTITLKTKMVDLPDGKKKRKLDEYLYDLGSCTFCMLCVTTCPQDALEFSNDFEQAVFTRDKLIKKLNYRPEVADPAPAPKPAPAAKPASAAAPAAKPASAAAPAAKPVSAAPAAKPETATAPKEAPKADKA
ncbi:MAG: 4Fe-4S binding protein [Muribaculaceae bacterium]|nr:4Fe-4S binding protein [Muribaculaceae bacterium]